MLLRKRAFFGWVMAGCLALAGMGLVAQADTAATAPAPATAPATAKATRAVPAILADLQSNSTILDGLMASPTALLDEKVRKDVGPKMVEPLKKMAALLGELGEADPRFLARTRDERNQFLAMLTLLGDADSAKALETAAASKDDAEAIPAKLAQSLAKWWGATQDAKAQAKVLDEIQALAKANPKNESIPGTLMIMSKMGPASPELARRAEDIVTTDLTSTVAQAAGSEIAADRKMHEAEGKPIVLAGKTVDGGTFSTASLKGKVILVDFWATWCGPCRAELPRVKAIYKKYHDQGLEILGISCDMDGAALAKYTKDNDMPWVQLWDKDTQTKQETSWHALAKQYGVEGIPTMFLIDRAGVLRTIDARENMEDMIPKLLAEKAPETQPATLPAK